LFIFIYRETKWREDVQKNNRVKRSVTLSDQSVENLEQELEGLKETMAIYLGSLIREVVSVFGERGKEVVREAARKGGLYQGEKYIKEKGITDLSTKGFADFYNSMSDVELFKIQVDEASDKRFVIKTNVCPYLKYWQEMGIPGELPDFCIMATYYDLGLAQAFNPRLQIELPEDMIRGSCQCVYVFKED
jgi:hypothetical protein